MNNTKPIIKIDKIDKILKNCKPKNEKEQFILNVYEKTKDLKPDFEKDEFKSNDYYNFDLSK